MPFFDVRHQERAQRILLRALAGGRMPHAYIFHGPPGVGKRMLADRLAMRLLCAAPQAVDPPGGAGGAFAGIPCLDACGRCQDCHTVAAGTHPDLHVIHRDLREYLKESEARKRKGIDLGIDIIREFLIDAVGRRPMRGRAKVFIVEEAERLSDEAQNAMLKTLEEPPPTTFIILLTRALDRLLPTTRSRAHPVPFRALPSDFVEEALRLRRSDLAPGDVAYLARIAEGRLGVAFAYAEDGMLSVKRDVGETIATLAPQTVGALAGTLGESAQQFGKRAAARHEADISDTEANRIGLRALLAAVAAFYADALRCASGATMPPTNADQPHVIEAIVRRHTRRGLTHAIREIVRAESNIDRSANVTLTLEALAIRLARCK